MADLIDRVEFEQWTREFWEIGDKKQLISAIRNAPAIDPIHAAGGCYCRECEYSKLRKMRRMNKQERVCFIHLDILERYEKVRDNDFCSSGKVRENER